MVSTYRRTIPFIVFLLILFISQGCGSVTFITPPSSATMPADFSDTTATAPSTPPSLSEAPVETANQLNLSQMNVDEWASTSPDGKWIATGLVAFPKESISDQPAYVRLMIFGIDPNVRWTIIEEWREIGLGFPIPAPLKWSNDGNYFYFTYRVNPDGCPVFTYLTDLLRVNLETGAVEDLQSGSSIALAISPNDSQAAYFYFDGQPEMGLRIRNLITGEEQETKINPGKEFNAGNIVWSPDGQSFALTLAIQPCAGEHGLSKTVWAEATTILLVDATTLEQKTLVQEDPRLFVTVEWAEPNKILITDGAENSLWHVDVNTGEITRP